MHPITADRLLWDHNAHIFTADASELGLPPGRWPSHIRVVDLATGNTMDFYRTGSAEGSVMYETGAAEPIARTLRVFND